MNNPPNDPQTYSVQLRLKGTVVDYGYVSVQVARDMVTPDGHLDVQKLWKLALDSAQSPEMRWYQEERSVEPHPIQKARGATEESLFVTSGGNSLND